MKLCHSGDENITHEQFYVMKLKHIFIFKCQELTVKSFKCTVREWKSRSDRKWKWIKGSAEWKHFKTWHQNCPWATAAILARVWAWVQEEEEPGQEHCRCTSKPHQAWIIQAFSPISVCLPVCHRSHLLWNALMPVLRLAPPRLSEVVRLLLTGCRGAHSRLPGESAPEGEPPPRLRWKGWIRRN